jgi:hypothetical protein
VINYVDPQITQISQIILSYKSLDARHWMLETEPFRRRINYKKTIIKMTERHAAQAPALREQHPQIFNFQ